MGTPGVQGRPPTADGDVGVDHVPAHFTPYAEQARSWIKGHRTLIASSTSSVLSTLSAVC